MWLCGRESEGREGGVNTGWKTRDGEREIPHRPSCQVCLVSCVYFYKVSCHGSFRFRRQRWEGFQLICLMLLPFTRCRLCPALLLKVAQNKAVFQGTITQASGIISLAPQYHFMIILKRTHQAKFPL